jgi:hypothetical protein
VEGGGVGDDLFEVMDIDVIVDEGERVDSLVEVGEEVGGGVFVLDFGEDELFGEGGVEGVVVDEVDCVGLLIDFGQFEET